MWNYIKKNWKLVVNILTVLLLGVVIYFARNDVMHAIRDLKNVNLFVIFSLLPLQFLVYYVYALLYQSILKILGATVDPKSLFKVSIEMNFVNHIFPSGGLSGISYFAARLKQYKVTTAQATLTQTVRFALAFTSYVAILFAGLFFLSLSGKASNLMILITCSIAFSTLFGVICGIYVIGSERRIKSTVRGLARGINKVIRLITGHHESIRLDTVEKTAIDLNENYKILRNKLPQLKVPLFYAILVNIAELSLVYTVYIAYGQWVNLGAVIIAFAIANTAGLVAALPGGVGVYEGLMTLVLISAGIPAWLSISATVMYRVIVLILSLATGYYLYHAGLSSIAANVQHVSTPKDETAQSKND